MIASKAVVSVALLMAVLDGVPAKPRPAIIRERHVIHAPIKFRVIHHYRIKEVPIVIKKHLHYHQKAKPVAEEEIDVNQVHQHQDYLHHAYAAPAASPQQTHHLPQEGDYEDDRQSEEEEDYDDYDDK